MLGNRLPVFLQICLDVRTKDLVQDCLIPDRAVVIYPVLLRGLQNGSQPVLGSP